VQAERDAAMTTTIAMIAYYFQFIIHLYLHFATANF